MMRVGAGLFAFLASSSRPVPCASTAPVIAFHVFSGWSRGVRSRPHRRRSAPPPILSRPWPSTFPSTRLQRLVLGPTGQVQESEYLDEEQSRKELESRVGSVALRNSQRSFPVDEDRLVGAVETIMEVLNCRTWDVSIWLTTDKTVTRLNEMYRGKRKSTDILSFPLHEVEKPGVLPTVTFAEEMELGEMIISLAYVHRQCNRDLADASSGDMQNERGVSGAMAVSSTLDERLVLLCVHGILHLMGYDHEADEEYMDMVEKEEDVLRELEKRGILSAS
jgi:probable rRNA maturation factor